MTTACGLHLKLQASWLTNGQSSHKPWNPFDGIVTYRQYVEILTALKWRTRLSVLKAMPVKDNKRCHLFLLNYQVVGGDRCTLIIYWVSQQRHRQICNSWTWCTAKQCELFCRESTKSKSTWLMLSPSPMQTTRRQKVGTCQKYINAIENFYRSPNKAGNDAKVIRLGRAKSCMDETGKLVYHTSMPADRNSSKPRMGKVSRPIRTSLCDP